MENETLPAARSGRLRMQFLLQCAVIRDLELDLNLRLLHQWAISFDSISLRPTFPRP
jgi:hypothetical protein